jgi:hypothetical protein
MIATYRKSQVITHMQYNIIKERSTNQPEYSE